MKTITDAELQIKLQKHKQWLLGDVGGEQLDLQEYDLSYKTLIYLNFSKAKLAGADFRYANLAYSNFSDADLTGANLTDIKIDNTKFTNAILKKVIRIQNNIKEENIHGN